MRQLDGNKEGSNYKPLKKIEKIEGGVIFFDLVKFTMLTSALSGQEGSAGSETLNELLREYFNVNIKIIRSYGGTIYQFAGDSALAAFEKEDSESESDFLTRLCSCAMMMKEHTNKLPERVILEKNFKISTKISVAAGLYYQVLLGDTKKLLNISIIGKTVERATGGEKFCKPDQIIVGAEIYNKIKDFCNAEQVDGYYNLAGFEKHVDGSYEVDPQIEYNESDLGKITHFIPPLLVERFTDENEQFVAEFRNVTSVFVGIKEEFRDEGQLKERVHILNEIFIILESMSEIYGGTLVQTDMSDKGTVFLILFGAPQANENKEELAVRFSLKLIQSLAGKVPSVTIGISTGTDYCGILGADLRRGYTVLGESVNLASRLMSSVTGSGVHIDSITSLKAKHSFNLKQVTGKTLKGISESMEIYSVEGERDVSKQTNREDFIIIGREEELETFKGYADQTSSKNENLILALRGDIGIGKTHLITAYKNIAAEKGFNIIEGLCFRYETYTAYFAWQNLLRPLFNLGDSMNESEVVPLIEEALAGVENVDKDWAPVIAGILGVTAKEKPLTENLDPKKKINRLHEIILKVLAQECTKNPVMLILDDYQWADESSINLLHYVIARIAQAFIVVVSVRLEGDLTSFQAYNNFNLLELGELDKEGCKKYLKYKMLLDQVDHNIEEQIILSSHGNPFFLESLILSMRESGQIVMDSNGKYKFNAPVHNMHIPQNLQDVVLLRIEKLKDRAQTVLKTASVIGRNFTLESIQELCSENIRQDLVGYLQEIQNQNFTDMESETPPVYFFKHLMTRDVAYNLLLLSTRKDLHRKMAELLEEKYSNNLEQHSENIAYHFLRTDELPKKIKYSLLAARKAKKRYSNNDALFYYQQTLSLMKEANVDEAGAEFLEVQEELGFILVQAGQYGNAISTFEKILPFTKDKLAKSRIHTGIGKAYQEKGEIENAISNLETALKYVGLEAPGSKGMAVLAVLKEIIRNYLHTLFPGFIVGVSGVKKDNLIKQLDILIILEKIYYFYDLEKLAWATFRETALAEKLKDAKYLSMAYGNYSLTMISLGMAKKSQKYYKESLDFLDRCDDAVAKGIVFNRYGTQGMYLNKPKHWAEYCGKASAIFSEVGEVWELLVTLSQEALAYYYATDFDKSVALFYKIEKIAMENDAKMYLGWVNTTIPFCNYLFGKVDAESALKQLDEGNHYSVITDDLSNQNANAGLKCLVLVRENNIPGCVEMSEKAYNLISRFKINIPHVQVVFVNAAEAALTALMSGQHVPVKKLEKIALNGIKQAAKFSRIMPYIHGSMLRVKGLYLVYKGKMKEAKATFEKAIEVCEKNPNPWELGLAYMDAARYIPEKSEAYRARAKAIFEEKNLLCELKRLENMG